MSGSNYIKNVAIVGAGGNSGEYMTKELLKTGKHTVTAISREGSQSKLPEGINVVSVNYDDPSTLVKALQGQDALVITMGPRAPPDTQMKLIRAAGDAGVKWILPNQWGVDTTHEGLCKDVHVFGEFAATNNKIRDLGQSNFIAVICGFWYEWSLSIPSAYGFDLNNREVTFFDDGKTLTSTSTWPQVGRAVAAILSLPIQPEDGNKERCLEHFKNQNIYINSFTLSQRDMFDSVLRVTGTKETDWKIHSEPSKERYEAASEAMQKGDMSAFARWMYTRVFYKDDSGNFEKRHGLANEVLGLPKEDLDVATKAAVERAKVNPSGYGP